MNEPNEHLDGVPPSSTPAAPPTPLDTSGEDVRSGPRVDLDAVERDLDGVERALGRLDDGTYWSDEVTGQEIPDEVLADDPTTRRAT